MTVLVTGGAGFLGSHVAELLMAGGERPRILLRPGEGRGRLTDVRLESHCADLCDRVALGAALRGVDRVIHCAARTGPWGPESEYEHTNVDGLHTLVTCALAAGVKRIVHVSSITVHGNDVRGVADEDTPLRAEPNPYSRSKLAGERLLQQLIREHGAPVTIVRPGWLYGPRDTASFARIARMVEAGRMVILGSGENHVPLIYVRDAARGIVLASEAQPALNRTYLLVNDQQVTQREFLGAIAAELGVPAPTRQVPYGVALGLGALSESLARLTRRRQPPPLMRYGIQLLGGENRFIIGRARSELGFSPVVDLEDGIGRSVKWHRTTGQAGAILEQAA